MLGFRTDGHFDLGKDNGFVFLFFIEKAQLVN